MRRLGGGVRRAAAALAIGFALGASPARADEPAGEEGLLSVDVHAFASQGFVWTTNNDYIDVNSTHGSFHFTEVGINFTKRFFHDRLGIGLQLFAQDVGPSGSFNAKMDWFYVDYRWQDWLGIRAGRLKIPYGIYNDVADIDSARVPILLPQSVYPLLTRNFLFAQNGGEIYGFVPLRRYRVGALEYRLFAGTILIDTTGLIPAGNAVQYQLNVPWVLGGRLFWETPLDGLRVGGAGEAIHLDATEFLGPTTSVALTTDAFAWLISAEYVFQDLTLTAEYGRGHTEQGTSNAMLPPPPSSQTQEEGYAMVEYRIAPWFEPGAYYSASFPDIHHEAFRQKHQHDFAATLRFDINSHWLVKLEGHYMVGTAALANPLTANSTPATKADEYWSAFFVKTTGYF